jgi:N-methylhydantoinase A
LRSRLADIAQLEHNHANALLAELRAEGVAQLTLEGFPPDRQRFRYFLDMRYAGQGYENPVPLDGLPIGPEDLSKYRSRFDDIHKLCHGHAAPGQPVEVVNYRVEAIGVVPRVELARLPFADAPVEPMRSGGRKAYFAGLLDVPVYAREKLRPGHCFAGPAIVEQYDATTVVCPEQTARVDEFGNLIVEIV